MDDLTHSVTITINGNYPHGQKQHAQIILSGDGHIDHMIEAFKAALIAAGFSMDTAKKLEDFMHNDEIVTSAQEIEREACAKRAEQYMLTQYGNHYGVANAVRSNETK